MIHLNGDAKRQQTQSNSMKLKEQIVRTDRGGLSTGARLTRQPTGFGGGLRAMIAATALLCWWAVVVLALGAVTRASWTAARSPGPARPEDAIGVLVGGCGVAVGLWLAVATLCVLVSAIRPAGAVGAAARAASDRLAPRTLRRVVGLAVGVTLFGAPVAATAAPLRGDIGVSGTASAATSLDPSWAATAVPPVRTRTEPAAGVVVHRGDSLWSIAARYLGPDAGPAEIAAEWPRWYAVNRSVIGPNPDHLEPGQRLRPPATRGSSHGTASQDRS
jgi:hypothetical protein